MFSAFIETCQEVMIKKSIIQSNTRVNHGFNILLMIEYAMDQIPSKSNINRHEC